MLKKYVVTFVNFDSNTFNNIKNNEEATRFWKNKTGNP